jgi:hypothetical protein
MVSKHRYCLSESGEVVLADDIRARSLLVGKGCVIEDDVIKRYGFVNGELPKSIPIESKEGKQPEINLGALTANIIDLRSKEDSTPKPKGKGK